MLRTYSYKVQDKKMAAMRKSFLAFVVMRKGNESLKLYIRNLVRREIMLCMNGSLHTNDRKYGEDAKQ
jgi:L-rhamnose isomerase